MKALLFAALLGLGAAALVPPAHSDTMVQHADSLLAAAGTFKVYSQYNNFGAGHNHAPQFVTVDNGFGYGPATSGFVYTSASALRIKLWGGAFVDTSGCTLPAGGTYTFTVPVDSLSVLNIGGTQTTVTFEVKR